MKIFIVVFVVLVLFVCVLFFVLNVLVLVVSISKVFYDYVMCVLFKW